MPGLSLLRLMQIRPCLSRVQVNIDSLLLQSSITLISAYVFRFTLHVPQKEAFFHLSPETFLNKKLLTFFILQARVTNDLNVNVVSPFIAAQEAIKHWETLPTGGKKLFIYTGNICNVAVLPVPLLLNGGMGKA